VPDLGAARVQGATEFDDPGSRHFPPETAEEEIEMIVPVWAIVLATAKQRAWVKGWKKR